MPTPAQPQSSTQVSGYTGMDDVLVPVPSVPFTIKSETYPFRTLSKNVNNNRETGTMVYVTSESFISPTSTVAWAEQWVTRHAGPKSKFQLLTRSTVESSVVPPVLDEKGKIFSSPYTLIFESMGAEDYPGTKRPDDDEHNRQMFYFLPASVQHIFTARVVRQVKYFEGYPQFEAQYEHFLTTLKRDTITPQSSLKGSKPLTRRFYTAFFSFEIYLPETPKGGNQWGINHSSKRSDLWRTPEGDIAVSYEIISGYDFDVARENQKLKMDAKGLVKNLKGVVKQMNPDAYVPELRYIETKFAGQEIYGHREDRESRVVIKLDAAYKTDKQITIGIGGPPAAINAHEKDILAWLSQFKILQ